MQPRAAKNALVGERLTTQLTSQSQAFSLEPLVLPSQIPRRRNTTVKALCPGRKGSNLPMSPRAKEINSWDLIQVFSPDSDFVPPPIDSSGATGSPVDKKISPTTMKFDSTGKNLAVGTTNGDVFLVSLAAEKDTYCFNIQFTAFEPKFNPLAPNTDPKSVVDIAWFPYQQRSPSLLAANATTIKLFRLTTNSSGIHSKELRSFQDKHIEFSIHSISINSDGETFLSADDLNIFLWNLEQTEALKIVNLTPENMDDLSDSIVCTKFHPVNCNLISCGMSSGEVRISDLRETLRCSTEPSILFRAANDPLRAFDWIRYFDGAATRSGSVQWSNDGKYLASREYLQVKVWDIRKAVMPVHIWDVGSQLYNKLPDLIDDDLVLDRFSCSWSKSRHIVTGGYNNSFYTFNIQNGQKSIFNLSNLCPDLTTNVDYNEYPTLDTKVRLTAHHPMNEGLISVATQNNLFLFGCKDT